MSPRELQPGITLLLRSLAYLTRSYVFRLPGRRFDTYGRCLGWRARKSRHLSKQLILNPVSSVRYFEYDFAQRCTPIDRGQRILDVASPVLFGFYTSEQLKCRYHYINLDEREISELNSMLPAVSVRGQYEALVGDALQIAEVAESYDVVVSISVIEHIPGEGDTRAVLEMWRVLRPGGRLILTFPVSGAYEEEYSEQDQYQIGLPRETQGYFFQRYYDEEAVQARLLRHLPNATVKLMELYGEREPGWFRAYEQRWIASGLEETVKDPYLMARHMKKFDAFSDLPGMGVVGLYLEKDEEKRPGK